MAEKDLHPLKGKGDPYSDEIRSRCKGATSEKKKLSTAYNASKRAKCKNCKLECQFRSACLKRDPEGVCIVPAMRAGAIRDGTKVVDLNDEKVIAYMGNLITLYSEILMNGENHEDDPKKAERETIRKWNLMFNKLKEYKQVVYPTVQKNINVNVSTNLDKMAERIMEYKKKEEEGKVIIFNEKEVIENEV